MSLTPMPAAPSSWGTRPAASGSYTLSDGSLEASISIVGYSGSGNFTQSGGTNVVGAELRLGYSLAPAALTT